jgi:predicted N-formylglutamate amidohydrolase
MKEAHGTLDARDADHQLLAADEPRAFMEVGQGGSSNFLIVVDHASCRIPRRLGSLGLAASELERHIAWDIGCLALAMEVARALDAQLVAQNYSRLVIDCNRDPGVPTSIPQVSESVEIPGNLELTAGDAAARRAEIFDPYHARIRELIDARVAAGQRTILVAQHSMTNVFMGRRREMHAAVLYNRDRSFAGLVLDALRREHGLIVADNEPYFLNDATDYTIPHHAEKRALPHVEIEVRQDLLFDEEGRRAWADRIVRALRAAERALLRST